MGVQTRFRLENDENNRENEDSFEKADEKPASSSIDHASTFSSDRNPSIRQDCSGSGFMEIVV